MTKKRDFTNITDKQHDSLISAVHNIVSKSKNLVFA